MNTLTKQPDPATKETSSFEFAFSDGGIDPAWDAFLESVDSGHHVQSGLWSDIKSLNGWKTRRMIASQDGQIVGGAQLLIKQVKFAGSIGYVPKGPVLLNPNDASLASELVRRIRDLASSERLRVLFVQPPEDGAFVKQLTDQGFTSCPVETAPTATILIDLTANLDTILARMKKGMRNQIRRSQKRGITVREGTKADLPAFYGLLSATSQRRGFSTFDLEYFQGMWDILAPTDSIKLFVGELDGVAVSAQFGIPFGDTFIAKQIGWSGEHRKLHPNEALDWFTIQWCKDEGFKYYDLEGIERPAAEAIAGGQSLPNEYSASPTAYKMRLGGEVRLYPTAYCFVSNPVLRTIYNRVGAQVANWDIFQKAVGRFRTG